MVHCTTIWREGTVNAIPYKVGLQPVVNSKHVKVTWLTAGLVGESHSHRKAYFGNFSGNRLNWSQMVWGGIGTCEEAMGHHTSTPRPFA